MRRYWHIPFLPMYISSGTVKCHELSVFQCFVGKEKKILTYFTIKFNYWLLSSHKSSPVLDRFHGTWLSYCLNLWNLFEFYQSSFGFQTTSQIQFLEEMSLCIFNSAVKRGNLEKKERSSLVLKQKWPIAPGTPKWHMPIFRHHAVGWKSIRMPNTYLSVNWDIWQKSWYVISTFLLIRNKVP